MPIENPDFVSKKKDFSVDRESIKQVTAKLNIMQGQFSVDLEFLF
ncbi:MAG: hypothetical protein AB8G05_24855 [Oligoflexales bacterium]